MRAPPARGRQLKTWALAGSPPAGRLERFRGVSLSVADLTPAALRGVLEDLRAHAADPPDREERCDAIASAARRVLESRDPFRAESEAVLPALTGFSPAMVREALDRVFGAVDRAALLAATAARREAHRLVGIVAAGNVPGVAVAKMALALASGSACFVKPASGEPILAALFAEAIAAESPALGRAVGVAWWRGGQRGLETVLSECADSIVAYGSDEAIAALRRVAKGAFVGHGHRLSVALVHPGGGNVDAIASALASDVALYDQLGCLSPQCVWVVGGEGERRGFADALGRHLARLSVELPRGEVPPEASAAIRRLRDEIEWRAVGGESVALLRGASGTEWTIAIESRTGFRPSPLHRTIWVLPLEDVGELPRALGEARGRIECVGAAPLPDAAIEAAVRASGIPNLVPVGEMQRPSLRWRQGGLDPLSGIVRERERGA